MQAAVRTCEVLLIVVSEDWLRKKWTTIELQWALDQREASQSERPMIMPVLCGVTINQLSSPDADFVARMHHWHGRLADQRLRELGRLHRIGCLHDTNFDG